MDDGLPSPDPSPDPAPPHRRRPRYRGKNPRAFHEKYKELQPARFPETVQKVLAAGKTPAGTHRPILLAEVLDVLAPQPGDFAVDCTLGYGGHAEALLRRIAGPGGHLLALDADPIEGARTLARLRAAGFGPDALTWERRNFAGLAASLAALRPGGAHVLLADLGVSSMQLDVPGRGFSVKHDGPLDMRMNPHRGPTAAGWLANVSPRALARALIENADEPRADALAAVLAGRVFPTTRALADAVSAAVPAPVREDTVRRVFQAVRIAVNEEFGALDTLLRTLPGCLAPGGRAAILTFHSGGGSAGKSRVQGGAADGCLRGNRGRGDPPRPRRAAGQSAFHLREAALGAKIVGRALRLPRFDGCLRKAGKANQRAITRQAKRPPYKQRQFSPPATARSPPPRRCRAAGAPCRGSRRLAARVGTRRRRRCPWVRRRSPRWG